MSLVMLKKMLNYKMISLDGFVVILKVCLHCIRYKFTEPWPCIFSSPEPLGSQGVLIGWP